MVAVEGYHVTRTTWWVQGSREAFKIWFDVRCVEVIGSSIRANSSEHPRQMLWP